MNTHFEIGDVVLFAEDYYNDPYAFMPSHDFLSETSRAISEALKQTKAIVTDTWLEGVWLKYTLFGKELTTNCFLYEIEPTNERIVFNDPSCYNHPLFELADNGTFTYSHEVQQWSKVTSRQAKSNEFRQHMISHFENWQDELTVDEQRQFLALLDSQCAAIQFGAKSDTSLMYHLLKVAESRFQPTLTPDDEDNS